MKTRALQWVPERSVFKSTPNHRLEFLGVCLATITEAEFSDRVFVIFSCKADTPTRRCAFDTLHEAKCYVHDTFKPHFLDAVNQFKEGRP